MPPQRPLPPARPAPVTRTPPCFVQWALTCAKALPPPVSSPECHAEGPSHLRPLPLERQLKSDNFSVFEVETPCEPQCGLLRLWAAHLQTPSHTARPGAGPGAQGLCTTCFGEEGCVQPVQPSPQVTDRILAFFVG